MSLAIVTGGSRGIGAAIAEKLAKDGHDVIINCASSVDKAEAVAEKCRAHGVKAVAKQWNVADYAACEMLVLPGGMPGTKHLGEHQGLCRLLREFADNRKYIAAICAAPMVLGSLGLLRGRYATIYPGMESHLAGAACEKHVVVWDGNLITSQGPGTAMIFALAIVDALCGQEMGDRIAEELILPHEEEE